MKRIVQRKLRQVGVSLERSSSLPYGISWIADVSSLGTVATVFDVGANVGQTAESLLVAFPDALIWAVEPVRDTYETLKSNFTTFSNVHPIRAAVGSSVGTAKINIVAASTMNTLSAVIDPSGQTEDVPLTTVDELMRQQGMQRLDVLKIDTEGFELDVLRGAREALRSGAISFVLAECDFFPRDDQPHGDFLEIFAELRDHGFHVVSFYTGGVDDLGWRWGNALFMLPRIDNVGFRLSPYARHGN